MRRIVFGEWTLDPTSGELSRGTETARLQDQALQVLLALLERPGQVVTREELIARLWPQVVVDYDTSLKSIVRKLRLALGDAAEQPRYIETLPRKGYRLVAAVVAADAVAPNSAAPVSARAPVVRRARPWLVAAAVGALAVVAAVAWRPSSPSIRLAVLPFESPSADVANAYLTASLYEEVVTALRGSAPELDVVPRATMTSYRARPDVLAAVRAELGATHVLEGTVRRDAEQVRVTVELMEAGGGRHLWSQSYERRLGHSMTLEVEVAAAVAAQLAVKLANRGGGLAPSTNPEAHDLYRRALAAMQTLDPSTPPAEIERVQAALDRAIELDPVFAAAYARRAQLRISKYVLNHDVGESNREAARLDLERARGLAGDAVAIVQAASRYAALFETGPDEALEILDTLELASSREPDVLYWRGFYLSRQGRAEEGLAAYELAARVDPGDPAVAAARVRELWALRRPLDALDVVREFNERQIGRLPFGALEFAFTGRTERLARDLDDAHRVMAADNRLLARFDLLRFEDRYEDLRALLAEFDGATIRVGGYRDYGLPGTGSKPLAELEAWASLLLDPRADVADEGRAVLEFVERQTPTPHNEWHLLMLAAEGQLFLGRRAEAVARVREALEKTPRMFDFVVRYSALLAARVFAWAGAHDEAVALLERLATQPPVLGPAEIARDPFFAKPLVGDERYRALARRLEAEIAVNAAAFAAVLGPSRSAPSSR